MQKIGAITLAALLFTSTTASSNALTFMSDKTLSPELLSEYYKTVSKKVYLGDIRIEQFLITNNMEHSNRKPTWIVIHDTANPSKSANASAHINYYEKNTREASAHYTVDDSRVIQTVLDKDIAFHAGGVSPQGCCNNNSIGIEMCINEGGDFDRVVDTTIKLTQYLMDKYNIPKSHVIRHYDVTGKLCPGKFLNEDPKQWDEFKNALKEPEIMEKPEVIETTEKTEIYSAPNKDSKIEATVNEGIRLDVISYDKDWCKVSVQGISGYIKTATVKADSPRQVLIMDNMTTMYSNTDISIADVTLISNGERISLISKGKEWSKVEYDNKVGYILNEKLFD